MAVFCRGFSTRVQDRGSVFLIGSTIFKMTLVNLAGQFGDTTYTKVFVGGLA
ncbi:hypothetical protein JHK85_016782 [Glycine max]|nr:hypothetical protein JHK85_016782 [Glycine max]